jgi:hypothetical protein
MPGRPSVWKLTGPPSVWKLTGPPSVWKLLGLAGLVGVAATGAAVARAERRRRAYTPDEIRERLHARHAETDSAGDEGQDLPGG